VRKRLPEEDSAFCEALLREGVECLIFGDTESGETVLRDYINATFRFEKLSELTNVPAKSLVRMFGTNGDPLEENLFEIIDALAENEGVQFELHAIRAA
jgi:hypothetical protein